MINAETIYQKASRLDSARLQEVSDFIDFLASKAKPIESRINTLEPHPLDAETNLAEELLAIGRHCAASPLLDKRTPSQILGYNDQGLPE